MTRLFILKNKSSEPKLLIATIEAVLWNRVLSNPAGMSVTLSKHENKIVYHLMLNPGIRVRDLIPIFYPDPDLEPEGADNVIRVTMHRMKRKLKRLGLQITPYKGNMQRHGKRLETIPQPRPIIDHHTPNTPQLQPHNPCVPSPAHATIPMRHIPKARHPCPDPPPPPRSPLSGAHKRETLWRKSGEATGLIASRFFCSVTPPSSSG